MLKRSAQWGGPGSVTPDASLPSRNGEVAAGMAAGQETKRKTRETSRRKRERSDERSEAEDNGVKR